MSDRVKAIETILQRHPNAFFVLSNGLTSREAIHYLPKSQCFYMLHSMGEALSIGIGLSMSRTDLEVVVIDGDYNALMGLASWAMMPQKNLSYYVLNNGLSETTGGQDVPPFPIIPPWCNVLSVAPGKEATPNPPQPEVIWDNCQDWLSKSSEAYKL